MDSPIAPNEFSELMAEFDLTNQMRVAVAVSGGPDSMALAALLQEYLQAKGGAVVALLFDHALRVESAAEIEQAVIQLEKFGIKTIAGKWERGEGVKTNHASARHARYAFLTSQCLELGNDTLCLAHHADDQAETVLMRLFKKSGVEGLAGIAPQRLHPSGVTLFRPLLTLPKARLVATCMARGIAYAIDPSNVKTTTARGAIRDKWAVYQMQGLDPASLLTMAAKARTDSAAQLETLAHAAERIVTLYPQGYATLDRVGFFNLLPSQQCQLLSKILTYYSGQPYPPKRAEVVRAIARLKQRQGVTLHGCQAHHRDKTIFLHREWRSLARAMMSSWQVQRPWRFFGAFTVQLKTPPAPGLILAPLGMDLPPTLPEWVENLPLKAIRAAIPVLKQEGKVVVWPYTADFQLLPTTLPDLLGIQAKHAILGDIKV